MSVRVCVAIPECTTAEAGKSAALAMRWADIVEIRADYILDLDLRRLLAEKRGPMLITLRAGNEGGQFAGPEEKRLDTLIEAERLGADYIDVEYSACWKTVLEKVSGEKVVLSYHNFNETPDSLPALFDAMAATGAGILKIATRARCLADNLKIARLLNHAFSRKINLCALAMGGEGIPSRILGPLWGSWMTFASMPGSRGTADGQIPADVLVGQYRVRDIGPMTRLFGVLGRPLGHSLSPVVHNAAFVARKMDAVYLPMEGAGLDDLMEFHSAFPVSGLSVTIPFKEEAHARAASLAIESRRTGAVNTLVSGQSGWHGENTDVDGFIRPLRRRLDVTNARAVVLGAGGAARAVICALRSFGAQVCVVARSYTRAQALAGQFQSECRAWEELGNLSWDLLVNTTPVGMYPDVNSTPVPSDRLTGKWVYDLVYNPRETRLLREAAQRGCNTLSGVEMFLGQAIRQQELWCGAPAPAGAMEEALERALSSKGKSESKEPVTNEG